MDSAAGPIEIRITRIEQLFNSFDPSPFDERDLDDDAESHIASWARELPEHAPIRILIHMPEDEAERARERGLAGALTHYFEERAEWIDRDRRELFRLGRRYLLVGLAILTVCLAVSQMLPRLIGPGPTTDIIQEGLVILGWVANWKPIEIFLYDWWPLKRRADLYRRIAAADVQIRTA
ncbi:MAG: hypothetical protein ACM3L9_03925 [Deltaproteobacteria bacterium]